ncbi:cell division ATP-binding protein FtsE [Thermicanus aegyptius]|uniref:cell division ATP-binding protein FtsE n=1 Tax=Thermicanus aegyptius TaxID=94009 RepID=UPI0004191BE8|nr:cell division ATP-binding protein FtsE [Thermicanus aegyptius]
MIEMRDVWKKYNNGTTALQGINLSLKKGEFVYLIGPSGAGKSTFIKLLYREEKATKGEIFVNGIHLNKIKRRQIPFLRRDIGIVFQDYRLLPTMTVYENVAFAMEVIEKPPREIRRRVKEILYMVGLQDHAHHYPDELSGGEQQRVAIAWAIVNNPSMIIADEPTGNLDPETSLGIMKLLDQINLQGTTVIMATHDKEIVNRIKKRVIAIDHGRIVRDDARGGYDYEI